jgi:acyl-CoA-binding protein
MKFSDAAQAVTQLSRRPNNDMLLKLYALYKQGSEGDVRGSRPGILDIKGRAKFDAWKKIAGLSKEEAQSSYIGLVQDLVAKDKES